MAYGISAELLSSQATTPVSTETVLVFIGNSEDSNGLNEPVLCHSYSEYENIFGQDQENYSLSMAAKCFFELCNLNQAIFISVSNDDDETVDSTAVVGTASLETGVYAVSKIYPKLGLVPSIVIPTVYESAAEVITALNSATSKINGHFDSMFTFGVSEASNQVNGNIAQPENINKSSNLERGIACWPHVITASNDVIPASVYIACLMARADAEYNNIPMRTQGNLNASEISGIVLASSTTTKINLSEASATVLADKGITSFINVGAGRFYSWGDSTSALTATGISDERGRFTSTMRILLALGNRFQQVWRNEIDSPMTLSLRNDILNEEQNYLDYLKSQSALIGYPRCEFRPDDNTVETIQAGRFYFTSILTATAPARYIDLKIAFTSEGYAVLLSE